MVNAMPPTTVARCRVSHVLGDNNLRTRRAKCPQFDPHFLLISYLP